MMIGQFDQTSQIFFTQAKKKQFDSARIQGAMFTDRPDLWQKQKKLRSKRVPPGQEKLL